MRQWDMDYLGVMVDMAGCPNRCRHCWLGSHRNGNISIDNFRNIADEFRNWRDENGHAINELVFFSWWRESNFRDDYRELWQLEQELSSPGQADGSGLKQKSGFSVSAEISISFSTGSISEPFQRSREISGRKK